MNQSRRSVAEREALTDMRPRLLVALDRSVATHLFDRDEALRILATFDGGLNASSNADPVALGQVRALLTSYREATCVTDGAPCSWHRVAIEIAAELDEAMRGGA